MERGWNKMQEENRLRKMKMDAEAAGNRESEGTEATIDIEALDGTETGDTTEESEEEKTVLSPKESSTNNPKGMKKKKKMNVELAAGNIQDEELILSPKESSTNNPKGMKRVREEEEEEEEDDQEDKEKKLKADSLSDTGTSKFPTSPPIDKFMDSDKDDQPTRSPPGDL